MNRKKAPTAHQVRVRIGIGNNLDAGLRKWGFEMGQAGLRYLTEDPTNGNDPDWRGAGFYYQDPHPNGGIVLLGVTPVQARAMKARIVQALRRKARLERWKANAPRRAHNEAVAREVFLGVVRTVVSSAMENAPALIEAGKEAIEGAQHKAKKKTKKKKTVKETGTGESLDS